MAIFKHVLVVVLSGLMNWKTTILGTLGLIDGLVRNSDVFLSGNAHDIIQAILPPFGIFLLGLFAKDADKTGVVAEKVVEKHEPKAD